EAVFCKFGAMYGITELLCGRSIGIVWTEIGVIRLMAICAPMTFVFTGVGIIDDDSMVPISIGHINFVRLFIDKNLRRQPQVLDIVAAFTGARLSNLHQQLSILS